jgi:iduronate 2-sulfatase
MSRRFLFLFALACVAGDRVSAAEKLNVLFIAVDDLKPTIGAYGDTLARTPNIDRLAARGTLFERAYCMQAVCSPSRNAMLTGLRPQTLRIFDLGTNFRNSVPDVVTLPQHFKQHGWKAEAMGKLFHVGHGNHEDPVSWSVPHWQAKSIGYVLDENKAKLTREEARFENKNLDNVANLPRGAPFESADVPDNTYADGKLADEAVARLKAAKQNADQPFFIAVGFLKPHLPFCAPKKYWDMHDPAKLPQPARTTPPA